MIIALEGILLTNCWWISGDEEKEEAAEIKSDAEGPDIDINVIDNIPKTEGDAVDKKPKIMEETNSDLLRKIDNIPNAENNLERNTNEVLSKDEIAKFNRDSFEKKLDEVIKAHESHHLSKETHFDPNGEHNDEYDHEAFLGDEAEEFRHLTPEESKEKLGLIVKKIDLNNDTFIDVEELTKWITDTANRSASRRTEEFWKQSNPENRVELSWDEYRAIQYGFLTDGHITDKDGRWVEEEDVDAETLRQYKALEERDRRRWTVADRNKNLHLSKDEFQGFIHPEYAQHMYGILMSETMGDLDKDGDGKLDLAEYVKSMYGETKSVADWDNGAITFKAFRDKNSDGFIDKEELMAWMHPEDYDQNRAEADHLIYEADKTGDKVLSMEEVLNSYTIFVSSQATDFGQDLHYHHDEL